MPTATTDSSAGEVQTGSPCVACRLMLPIEPAPISEEGEYWHCTQCDTRHHGVLLNNAPFEIAKNIRPSEQKKTPPQPKVEKTVRENDSVPLPAHGKVTCDYETEVSKQLDQQITRPGNLSIKTTGPAFLKQVKEHGVTPYDSATEQLFEKQYEESCDQVENLVVSLEKGHAMDLGQTQSITRDSLSQVAEDMDLFVKLGITVGEAQFVGKHNYHVAMLAASLGVTLGWDEKTILELGMGCLLHDIGMSRVPQEIRDSQKVLGAKEFAAVALHPLHTFEILEANTHIIPPLSRLVAYQIHERCDGSGYPRNRRAAAIHEAAKVAAVADVFVALVSQRPHRSPMMPHFAAVHLLHGVREGKFDSAAVRALLKTVSLYPIGSYLELKDGRIGRVLRAHREQYARPVVELWQPKDRKSESEIVDLAEHQQSKIRGPVVDVAGQ